MVNLDYLYNPDSSKDILTQKHFVDKKIHFKIIKRGTILPHKHLYVNGRWIWGFGGIVDDKNNFVKGSFVFESTNNAYTPTEEVQHSPETVVFVGLFYPVWGHAISDNIRLLWFLRSAIFNSCFKNCSIVYIPWGGGTLLNIKKILVVCSKF